MTRDYHRHPSSSLFRLIASIAAVATAAAISATVGAQSSDWRIVENPYQEDIEYSIGDSHSPRIEVEEVRWRALKIDGPDRATLFPGDEVEIDITLEFENRRNKSAKILVILLLEDAEGRPLDRIEMKQFKLAAGRLKERKESTTISETNYKAVERVYVFFEVTK